MTPIEPQAQGLPGRLTAHAFAIESVANTLRVSWSDKASEIDSLWEFLPSRALLQVAVTRRIRGSTRLRGSGSPITV